MIQKTAWDITASARDVFSSKMGSEYGFTTKKNGNRIFSAISSIMSVGRRPREHPQPSVIEIGLDTVVMTRSDGSSRPERHGSSDELECERSSENRAGDENKQVNELNGMV